MNKSLTIIIAALVFVIVLLTLIPLMTSSLQQTVDQRDQLQDDTACEVQTREAERADDPSMVTEGCLDYIDDPNFQSDAEEEAAACILLGDC